MNPPDDCAEVCIFKCVAVCVREKDRLKNIVHTHAAQVEHVYVFSEGGILPGHV